MNIKVHWNQNMKFDGESGPHHVAMDAKSPIGRGEGLTPKELVAIGLAGCTAMDVAAMMKKHKQEVKAFGVETQIETTSSGHPAVFTEAFLTFRMEGNVQAEKLIEAVTLSQTKYCGVSAMLSKALPIKYQIILNGEEIGHGQANFEA